MAIPNLSAVPKGPTVEDRMMLAKMANEEINVLITVCKALSGNTQLDDIQRQIAVRGMMARIDQLSDIAWTALAEIPENFEELQAQVEFLGPV